LAEPTLNTVFEPNAPPVSMFAVLVTPVVGAPIPLASAAIIVAVPMAVVVAVPVLTKAADTVTTPDLERAFEVVRRGKGRMALPRARQADAERL